MLLCLKRCFEGAELRARRAVDHLVAEHDAHAGDQVFVQVHLRAHLAPGLFLQALREVGDLRLRKLERRVHFGFEDALALVLQRLELRADLGQQLQAPVLRKHAHEVLGFRAQAAGEDGNEYAGYLLVAEVGVCRRGAYALIDAHHCERRQHFGPPGERARLIGKLERGLGVGTRDGARFGHLELLLDRVEKLAVRSGVDFPPQDLRGAGHGERGDVVAQLLARARHFLLDLSLGRGLFPCPFFLRGVLRFLDHLPGALLGLRKQVGSALARFPDLFIRALAGSLERAPALLGRGEAVGDGLLPRLDRAQHVRPDELHRHPDEQGEGDGLRDQRQVNVHYWKAVASGLANAKNMAMPNPMMNDASIKPRSRKTLPCSELVSSGWRAAASRKRLHMMPTPMHAPAAPRPIISPMPMPVYAWTIASS